MDIINFEKKQMVPLTSKAFGLYLNQTNRHICKNKFEDKYTTDKNYCKVRNIGITQVNTEVLHIE